MNLLSFDNWLVKTVYSLKCNLEIEILYFHVIFAKNGQSKILHFQHCDHKNAYFAFTSLLKYSNSRKQKLDENDTFIYHYTLQDQLFVFWNRFFEKQYKT